MLAIQRPGTMGSTQPSDVNLPFGYSYDPSQEFLFLDAPEPAPGAPLLSDNETKLLSSFFEDVTSDNYNTTSFGEGLNFTDDWLNLPPQFMGTATSFGQTTAPLGSPVHGLSGPAFHDLMPPLPSMMPPPLPPHPAAEQQASADVLAAATLLQNGSMSRSGQRSHEDMFGSRDMTHPLGPPVGHLRHQPIADFRQDDRRVPQSQVTEHENLFTDMMFGSSSRPAPRVGAAPVDVPRWGSDSNFGRAGFTPQSEKETREALENDTLKYMECLEVSKSAATTRPSSPLHNGDTSPLRLKTKIQANQVKEEEELETPPRKRRKSKAKDDTEGSDEELPSASSRLTAARKRKSKADGLSGMATSANDGSGRRRKSGINGAPKPPRENLTEEQKRENHIKSEQKRRTLIKEGFDDLCDLVPGLKGGGFSKSTMLAMAAEWLEDLLKGNEQLRAQLAELGGQ